MNDFDLEIRVAFAFFPFVLTSFNSYSLFLFPSIFEFFPLFVAFRLMHTFCVTVFLYHELCLLAERKRKQNQLLAVWLRRQQTPNALLGRLPAPIFPQSNVVVYFLLSTFLGCIFRHIWMTDLFLSGVCIGKNNTFLDLLLLLLSPRLATVRETSLCVGGRCQ